MGLLEGAKNFLDIGGGGPSFNVTPIDGGTQKLIGDSMERSGRSDTALATEANRGVGEAGNQALQTDDSLKAQAAGSGQDSGMLQAIRNKYNQVAGQNIQKVVRQNQLHTSLERAHMMQQSAHAAMAQQQVETQNYSMLSQAMSQADAARAQILSSILGVGGMAGGMYMANRKTKPQTPMTTKEFNNLGPAGGENYGSNAMMENEGSINSFNMG